MFEPKELVEIIAGNGIKQRKRCLIEGNQVVLEKGQRGKGHAAWKAKFTEDCFLYRWRRHVYPPFDKFLTRKLMVREGATECVHFQKTQVDIPVYDKETAKAFMQANVIKHAGETTQKVQIPPFVYVLLFMNFGVALVLLLAFLRRIGF